MKLIFFFFLAPKDECVLGLTKMYGCSACQGIPAIKTCKDFCVNVMKGCLAYHSELGDSWDKFVGE
jgi:glypican 4 (K-glypican)